MTTVDIAPEITCPPIDLGSDELPLKSDLHLQQITILQEGNNYYA